MNEPAFQALVAEEDRQWIRDLIEEHGLKEETEAEARTRVQRDIARDTAVRVGVWVLLFAAAALIMWACGAALWVYFIVAGTLALISK